MDNHKAAPDLEPPPSEPIEKKKIFTATHKENLNDKVYTAAKKSSPYRHNSEKSKNSPKQKNVDTKIMIKIQHWL